MLPTIGRVRRLYIAGEQNVLADVPDGLVLGARKIVVLKETPHMESDTSVDALKETPRLLN